MLVGGESVNTSRRITVHHPFDGRDVGSVPIATHSDITKALLRARNCRPTLSRQARVDVLHGVAGSLRSAADQAAGLISIESGLCLKDTHDEVARAIAALEAGAAEVLRDAGEAYSDAMVNRRTITHQEPLLGVIAAVTPFNHPLNQVAHKLIPAVATNNRIVIKPSEKTPLSALFLADLFYQAGYPPEALSVVTGNAQEIVTEFLSNDHVEAFAFTGSVDVGMRLARQAGFRRQIFELGGNDALIVLEDADIDLAAKMALRGAFRNSGQRCTAVKRILVSESVADQFLDRLVHLTSSWICGDPLDPETDSGTVIDEAAARRIEERVEAALRSGARLCMGHRRNGALYSATVIDRVSPNSELVREETFGPVAPVIRFANLDEAIALANASRFGLATGVCTQRLDHISRLVAELEVGMININETPSYRIPSAPFGGLKSSGLGLREGIRRSMNNFTQTKTVSLPWLGHGH